MKTKDDLRIGEIAALEDLLSTCENDIDDFRRDDLTEPQNNAMWEALERLRVELTKRRDALMV